MENEDTRIEIFDGAQCVETEILVPIKKEIVKKGNIQILEWFTFEEKLPVGDSEILCRFNRQKVTMAAKFVITKGSIAIPVASFYEKWAYLL